MPSKQKTKFVRKVRRSPTTPKIKPVVKPVVRFVTVLPELPEKCLWAKLEKKIAESQRLAESQGLSASLSGEWAVCRRYGFEVTCLVDKERTCDELNLRFGETNNALKLNKEEAQTLWLALSRVFSGEPLPEKIYVLEEDGENKEDPDLNEIKEGVVVKEKADDQAHPTGDQRDVPPELP